MRYGKLALFALCVLPALPSSVQAQTPAFALIGTSDFRNASWAFGEVFTVGAQNITVSALGAYDAGDDGFVTAGGIPVGIYRESDGMLLASTSVTSADPLTAHYRYDAISSLTLLSGQQYRVVAVNEDDLYNIATGYTVDVSITHDRYAYGQSTTLQSLNNFTGNERIWMANFQIGPAAATPEPGSIALLVGMGLSGAGFLARRKRARKVA